LYNIKKGDLVFVQPHPWTLANPRSNDNKFTCCGLVLNISEDIADNHFNHKCTMVTIYTYSGKKYDIDIDYLEKIE